MSRVIILGAGAAPGVPSLSMGWGDCNPNNPKNRRTRTTTYYEFGNTKILVDTSPDLRQQLINQQIRDLDGVLYTHTHADHLHGIDDLREINRIKDGGLNIYASQPTMTEIKRRFDYLVASKDEKRNVIAQPHLIPNEIVHNEPFYINDVKICPIKLIGHVVPTTGYVFNDGEAVHIADGRHLDETAFVEIKVKPKLLILPLTTPNGQLYHASLEETLATIAKIAPQKAVLNHLATECDYDAISKSTPENTEVAFDNMIIEL